MIPSNTSFWAGVILPVTVGDTIAVLHTAQNSFPLSITNSGEFWADYTFHSFGDPTNWNDEIALAVFPVVFFSDAGLKAMPKVTTSIYPNPADEVLNIEFNTTVKTVEIITLDGKIVTSKNTDKSTASIDVRSLTSGIYWCRITAVSGEITTHKFVKK